MKKLFFVAMAAVAMTFGSCTDNKPAPVVEPEEEEIEMISTDSLATVLEAADSTQLGSLLQTVQEQIENLKNVDPAKAKEYLANVFRLKHPYQSYQSRATKNGLAAQPMWG